MLENQHVVYGLIYVYAFSMVPLSRSQIASCASLKETKVIKNKYLTKMQTALNP